MFDSSYLMLYYFEYRKNIRKSKRNTTHDIYETYPIKCDSIKYENPIVKIQSYSVESDAATVVFNPKPKHLQ
jgi:hypothetical protein